MFEGCTAVVVFEGCTAAVVFEGCTAAVVFEGCTAVAVSMTPWLQPRRGALPWLYRTPAAAEEEERDDSAWMRHAHEP